LGGLEHHAHAGEGLLGGVVPVHVDAQHLDEALHPGSLPEQDQPVYRAQQGRLAAARGAEHRVDSPPRDGDGHAVEHLVLPEPDVEPQRPDGRLPHILTLPASLLVAKAREAESSVRSRTAPQASLLQFS